MRILLTGAGGNLGAHTLPLLLAAGHQVRTFDLDSKATRQVLERYRERAELCFGDLSEPTSVQAAVRDVEAIVHDGAVTPPESELSPELAERVNVGGTTLLLDAARRELTPPRFLYASSIAAFGVTQPGSGTPLDVAHPLAPSTHYGRHKRTCEQLVRASGLPFCILRIAVAPPLAPQGGRPEHLAFLFAHALDSRVEFVHPRDVALAQARALELADAWGKLLLIGGGARCQLTLRELLFSVLERAGIGALPEAAFGSTPLFGDWLDTRESEQLLRYQRHDFADYLGELSAKLGWTRLGVRLMRPLLRRYLLRHAKLVAGQAGAA